MKRDFLVEKHQHLFLNAADYNTYIIAKNKNDRTAPLRQVWQKEFL